MTGVGRVGRVEEMCRHGEGVVTCHNGHHGSRGSDRVRAVFTCLLEHTGSEEEE